MIVYKWLRPDLTTRDGYAYTVGVPAETDGSGDLCGPGWLHAYADPLLAVLLRSEHVPDEYTVLYRCEAGGAIQAKPDKLGCTRLTLIEAIAPPKVTTAQRVRFGILAAWEVTTDPAWRAWAARWLSGEDRSTWAAAEAATWAAARAAEAAAWAAEAATWAAEAREARAAEAAEAAAWAAAWAAAAEARAAEARAARADIDLVALAHRAVAEEVAR